MPSSIFKNSKIFQLTTLYKIYGPWWTIKLSILALKRYLFNVSILHSYSQYGEDLFMAKLLNHKKNIFYIDIGSNHPTKFNNTYHFYRQGHAGIVVEPAVHLIKLHKLVRPRDVSLNIGISNHNSTMDFYEIYPDVGSTFSKAELNQQLASGAKLIKTTKIKTLTLSNLINKYAKNTHIDILSVDTEGHDLEVLSSNDWQKHRPGVVCVETLKDSGVHDLLIHHNYRRVFQNAINSIYETM